MKTIKLYKKFKKYEYGTPDVAEGLEGGLTGKQKFSQGVGYANAGLQVANMGMQMFGDQGNEFGVKDDGSAIAGGALSGAAQGASMGSVAGPWGTAIGAGVGGIYGGIKAYQGNEEAKARQEEFESQQRQLSIKESQNKWQQTLASGFKPQGNEFATKYAKYGGLMKMGNGGNVQQLSKDAVEFKGNSHEMGGIKEPVVNGRVLEGAEVEDEETMQGNFIFSEELGFAQRHKPLAKMLGKLEKKAQSNPNDKVNNSTIARVNSQIDSLKKEQEETKESLGIENDLGEMKNGGLYKKMGGGGKYVNDGTNQSYTDASGTYVITGKNNTLRYKGLRDKDFRTINDPNGIAAINKLNPSFQYTPSAVQTPPLKRMESSEALGEFGNYQKSLTDPGRVNVDDTTMMLPEGSTSKTKVNWGNLASGLAPYVGVAANYMVNEQAKKLRLPQEKLTTPISLQRVNYDNRRAEADIQRGQLNKITNRNLTNSAVASAVMAQNLGTTIRQKNAINESEMNTNRLIGNEEVGKNKSIEQYNNTTQVGNEDRFYNRDRDYLQNKGQIATNLSQMVQQQRADKMKYDLEDRKIEAISKADAGRDVWYRKFLEDQKKANATHALTTTEEVPVKTNRYGGKVKSSLRKKVGC